LKMSALTKFQTPRITALDFQSLAAFQKAGRKSGLIPFSRERADAFGKSARGALSPSLMSSPVNVWRFDAR